MATKTKRSVKRVVRKVKRKLSPAQMRQRRYASAMRGVRKRATGSRRGRGRIRSRKAATTLRRKYRIRN